MFKIFVGNLDYKVRPEQVRELFALYAPIEDLVIPTDPKTKKSRGFAIVMIRDPELGAAAVRGVQGKRLLGRELVVNEAIKKKGKAPPPSTAPVRSGPFGPKMFSKGDVRGRASRNPRRASGSASIRPGGSVPPQAQASESSRPLVPPVSIPGSMARSKPVVAAPGAVPAPESGTPSADIPKPPVPKARPKSSPPT